MKKKRSSSSPVALLGHAGKRTLILLALVSVGKAAGLILVADGVTSGIVAVIDGSTAWRQAVVVGLVGGALRAAAAWASRTVAQRGSRGEKSEIRERLALRLLHGQHDRPGAMAVLGTRGLDDLDAYFVTFLPALVAAAVVPPLVGARILLADPVSAIVIVLTIPLVPVFMILIGKHTKDRTEKATDALLRLSGHLAELAKGLPVLVGLGRVGEQSRALRALSDDYARRTQKTLQTAFLSSLAMELIATISVAVVAVFIGVRLVYGGMALEAGLLVLVLAAECYLPLREAGAAYHASEDGLVALRRVKEALDEPSRAPLWVGRRAGTVRVRALTVHFPGRAPLFQSFGMDAPVGVRTLLQGASGAGKTTLLRLIAGRETAAEASGLISGVPEDGIAWASQHPQFSQENALAELLLHAEGDEAEARAVLDELGLGESTGQPIESMSPGQRRRVAVARALWRADQGARLLLLDEPTAHLDEASARCVREAIGRRRGVTTIVASHDLRMRAFCEHRVVLDSGAVPASSAGDGIPVAAAEDPEPRAIASSAVPVARAHSRGVLRSILAARPWTLALAVLLGVLATGFSVTQTALSGWLIVRAAEQPPILLLSVAIVGVRFFGLGRAVLRYLERLELHRAVFAIAGQLRVRLWQVLAGAGLRLPGLRRGPAALDVLIGDTDHLRDEIPRVIAPPLVAAISQLALIVVAGMLVPSAVPVLWVLFFVSMIVAPALAWSLDAQASRREREEHAAVARTFTGLAEAAEDISVHGVAAQPLRALREREAEARARARRAAAAGGVGQALSIFAVVAAALCVVATGTGTDGALLALVALATLSLGESAADAVTAVQRGPALRAVVARLGEVLALDSETPNASIGHRDGESPALVLRGVSARWPAAPAPVFTDVSLEAERGEWLSVMGPSGAGKSTLLAVLMGHLPAASGEVLVEGAAPRADRPGDIAWCPQEGHLFDSSLRANLLLARPRETRPSDAELVDALARVGLREWLDSLENGLDTRIGASGGFLSGGQRQRVAVARTLLTGAGILLLDEPTAHLDADGAERLVRDLREGLSDVLVVCVTHDEHIAEIAAQTPGARRLMMGNNAKEAPLLSGAS